MEMGEREICINYRMAKNKRRQIGILAELNGTTQEEILDILRRGGVRTHIKLKENPETLKKSERDAIAKKEFAEKSMFSKIETAETRINPEQDENGKLKNAENTGNSEEKTPKSRINPERLTNYRPPKEVFELVEIRILELNYKAEEAQKIIDECTEEYARLFEFMTTYGVTGEKYHTKPKEATAAEVTTAKEVK